MASDRMNVLIYSGPGSTPESVRHCLDSLRRLLSPNYAVYPVSSEIILNEPWPATCAALVMPGGADLPYCRTLNGEGNRRIRQYVNAGGAYIGFCAGGYYGSSRCEFEVGNDKLEVIGDRELRFYPDTCRGPAFPGFQYNSEVGTRAAQLHVEKSSFPSSGGVLPDVFRAYANGGSVFVNASKYRERGVEVLASYAEDINVDAGKGAAAVVLCRVGEGSALLTGPHPEFAAGNLSPTARSMNPDIVKALASDDQQRSDFLRACLAKMGLRVNTEEQNVPSLTAIHLSSLEPSAVSKILDTWNTEVVTEGGEKFLKGGQDKFHLATPTSTWSTKDLTAALTDSPGNGTQTDLKQSNDLIIDYDKITKQIIAHEDAPPSSAEAPYFNHDTYFESLTAYKPQHFSRGPQIGQHLLYGEVVTSTSTTLEKNPTLTSALPTGTVMTATRQLSGRGRGTNAWVSPPGSLLFSFVLRHPLSLSATAPVVFIQYLAALAVAEGVQSYDDTSSGYGSAGRAGSQGSVGGTGKGRYKDIPIKLKWPNDIYALDPSKAAAGASRSDRNSYVKIGGILVNSSYSGGDYTLIVGIGLNVSNAAPTTSLNAVLSALDHSSTSSPRHAPLAAFTLEKTLARILTKFEELYGMFCVQGFGGQLEQMYYRHWLHDGQVVVLETEGGARARIRGITTDWGLLRAEEIVETGREGGEQEKYRGTGKQFALQTDSNSFDFFKGLIKRKI